MWSDRRAGARGWWSINTVCMSVSMSSVCTRMYARQPARQCASMRVHHQPPPEPVPPPPPPPAPPLPPPAACMPSPDGCSPGVPPGDPTSLARFTPAQPCSSPAPALPSHSPPLDPRHRRRPDAWCPPQGMTTSMLRSPPGHRSPQTRVSRQRRQPCTPQPPKLICSPF